MWKTSKQRESKRSRKKGILEKVFKSKEFDDDAKEGNDAKNHARNHAKRAELKSYAVRDVFVLVHPSHLQHKPQTHFYRERTALITAWKRERHAKQERQTQEPKTRKTDWFLHKTIILTIALVSLVSRFSLFVVSLLHFLLKPLVFPSFFFAAVVSISPSFSSFSF